MARLVGSLLVAAALLPGCLPATPAAVPAWGPGEVACFALTGERVLITATRCHYVDACLYYVRRHDLSEVLLGTAELRSCEQTQLSRMR